LNTYLIFISNLAQTYHEYIPNPEFQVWIDLKAKIEFVYFQQCLLSSSFVISFIGLGSIENKKMSYLPYHQSNHTFSTQ